MTEANQDEKKKASKKKGCLGCLGGIVALFVLILIFAPSPDKPATSTTSPSQQATQQKQPDKPAVKKYKSGQYKVGADLPAGEYVAIARGDAYIEVATNSTGNLDSILANDIFINRSIITVSDGQYLKIQNAELYAFNDAPKVQPKDGFLQSGMYKVGVDLPAGEYKVFSEGGDSYIETSSASSHSLNDIIANDIFQGDKYVTVSDGQYVKFFRAKIQVK